MDEKREKRPGDEVIWTYNVFKQRIRKAVLDGSEISLNDLPDFIEDGNLGTQTEQLVPLTRTRNSEYLKLVGVERETPHALVYSPPIRGNLHGFEFKDISNQQLFNNETVAKLAGIGFVAHAHPVNVILSPFDLLVIQFTDHFIPGISLGTEQFKMMALRTDATKLISPSSSLMTSDDMGLSDFTRAKKDLILRHVSHFIKIDTLTGAGSKPGNLLSPDEITILNHLYDEIIRTEAFNNGIGLYIGKYGEGLLKKCDLSEPIVSNLS